MALYLCPFLCGKATVKKPPSAASLEWTPSWRAPKADGSLGCIHRPICPQCTAEHTYYPDDDASRDGPILRPGHALPAGIIPE